MTPMARTIRSVGSSLASIRAPSSLRADSRSTSMANIRWVPWAHPPATGGRSGAAPSSAPPGRRPCGSPHATGPAAGLQTAAPSRGGSRHPAQQGRVFLVRRRRDPQDAVELAQLLLRIQVQGVRCHAGGGRAHQLKHIPEHAQRPVHSVSRTCGGLSNVFERKVTGTWEREAGGVVAGRPGWVRGDWG